MAVYERYELTVLDEKQEQVEKLHQAYKLWIETKKSSHKKISASTLSL